MKPNEIKFEPMSRNKTLSDLLRKRKMIQMAVENACRIKKPLSRGKRIQK